MLPVHTAELWWHSLHYNEWVTIKMMRGAAGYFLYFVTDLELTIAATASDLDYESERFWWFVATYGLTKVKQGLPPPLDVIWVLDSDTWDHIESIVSVEGDADWCLSLFWGYPGNQGGSWPICWP